MGLRARRGRAARRLGRRRDPHRAARGRSVPRAHDPGHRHRQRRRQPVDRAGQPRASARSRSTCARRRDATSSHQLLADGRRVPHQLPARRAAAPGARRRDAHRAVPVAGLRARPRLRRPRARRRPRPATTRRRSGPAVAWRTCSRPPSCDQPIGQRGAMGDRNGAMALAFGMAAALLKRTRTGKGSVVDVSLLATAMWTLSSDVLVRAPGCSSRVRCRWRERVREPARRRRTRTKDGRHIQLVFLEARPLLARLLPPDRPRRS